MIAAHSYCIDVGLIVSHYHRYQNIQVKIKNVKRNKNKLVSRVI